MQITKYLGIWMDHSSAHLTELINGTKLTRTIDSHPQLQLNEEDLYYKDESHMLRKEQNQLTSYYSKLSDIILQHGEVVLYGPTDAKSELYNLIKDNHLFEKIKIAVRPADKMTEIQEHNFVENFFEHKII